MWAVMSDMDQDLHSRWHCHLPFKSGHLGILLAAAVPARSISTLQYCAGARY
jgi:hypothetical protein